MSTSYLKYLNLWGTDVPATCQDIRNSDIYHSGELQLTSEIDPDGPYGNPPLPVTCLLTGPLGVVVS